MKTFKKIAWIAFPAILLFMTACTAEKATGSSPLPEESKQSAETIGEIPAVPEETEMKNETRQIRMTVGENSFIVKLEENESADALYELLKDGDRTISASNYGGFEKVCSLGVTLPSNDRQTTTAAGDVMLYSSNHIVIFYGSNSWAYTKLGTADLSAEELKQILSGPETEVTLGLLND